MEKPCVTMRDETEWVETVENGWNIIVGTNKEKILNAIVKFKPEKNNKKYLGMAMQRKKILDIINEMK